VFGARRVHRTPLPFIRRFTNRSWCFSTTPEPTTSIRPRRRRRGRRRGWGAPRDLPQARGHVEVIDLVVSDAEGVLITGRGVAALVEQREAAVAPSSGAGLAHVEDPGLYLEAIVFLSSPRARGLPPCPAGRGEPTCPSGRFLGSSSCDWRSAPALRAGLTACARCAMRPRR